LGEILKSIEINTLAPGLGGGDGNSDLHKIKPNLSFTPSFFLFEAMIGFN
jgi:hypothetical protein